MSQVTFQLDAYHRAVHTPEEKFQRMALVQVFHEAVLSASSMEEVEEALSELLDLDVEGFYRKAGPDLLETAIVLTCLHPSPSVERYVALLLDYSQLKDLISAWASSLQALGQFTAPDPPTFIKKLQASPSPTLIWDRVRQFACLSFSAILDRCSPSDFSRVILSETGGLLSVLSYRDQPPSDSFLQSSEFASLGFSLQSRISELKTEDLTLPLLKLLSHLLGLFPDPDTDYPLEDTLITTLFALEPDFLSLLLTWREWYISIYSSVDDLDQNAFHPHGIAALVGKAGRVSAYREVHLPCVVSNGFKMQVVLPVANLLFADRPEVGVKMIEKAVEDMDGEQCRTIQSPFSWVTEYRQWTLQFLKELLDLRRNSRVETDKVTLLFSSFLQLFTPKHRFLLLRRLAIEYQYDLETGLVVSLYSQQLPVIPLFAQPLFVREMTQIAFGKRPLGENTVVLTSAVELIECVMREKERVGGEVMRKIKEESVLPILEEAEMMCGEGGEEEIEALVRRMKEWGEQVVEQSEE